jgi:hypothetical protein
MLSLIHTKIWSELFKVVKNVIVGREPELLQKTLTSLAKYESTHIDTTTTCLS